MDNLRRSLDELEKEAWNPKPSMLESIPVEVELKPFERGEASGKHVRALHTQSLNGPWQMAHGKEEKDRLDPFCQWEDAIWADIPCSVHTALLKAGIIQDPTCGLQDKEARAYSYKEWWFKKKFVLEDGKNLDSLCFDGICYYGKVWLNGCYLGEHRGMFGRAQFDVSGILSKKNILIVKIENAPANPKPMSEYMDNDEGWHDGVVINCIYGWHYACLPSRGIWQGVCLKEAAQSVFCEPPLIAAVDTSAGIVDICFKIHGLCGNAEVYAEILGKNHNGPGGCLHYEHTSNEDISEVHLRVRIPDPRLWWPNDHGEQNLYELRLSFKPAEGKGQYFNTTFGIRTIEMGTLPGGPYEDKHNWTFIVNGKPMFVKGSNWCTLDVLLRFQEENYRRFLTLAKDQHIQLLRAWGGGMPELDIFYDLCDELGIMVMQEWPTCWDSQKDQPFDELEETVLVHMPRLRSHPSLIMWCGGNESKEADGPAMDMMARYAYELDGSRTFHRTSPWGGALHNYATYWDMEDIDVSLNLHAPFMGEFGMASAPNKNSVYRYVPEEEREIWPPERFGSFGHHTPRFNQLEPNDMEHLSKRVPEFTDNHTMDDFIWATQMAQASAIRHTLESYRCNWPYSTGICYYKLTDVYPACSWSTVDYYGVPKLSYFVIKESYKPFHGCLLFQSLRIRENLKAPVFLLDDAGFMTSGSDEYKNCKVSVFAYDDKFNLIKESGYEINAEGKTVQKLGYFELEKESVKDSPIFLYVKTECMGKKKDSTFYWLNYQEKPGCMQKLPQTILNSRVVKEDSAGNGIMEITNEGSYPAVGVSVESIAEDCRFITEDSIFWLEPGESRRIRVNITENLTIKAWNAEKCKRG